MCARGSTHTHTRSHRVTRGKSLGLMRSAPRQQSPRAFCTFPARVWGRWGPSPHNTPAEAISARYTPGTLAASRGLTEPSDPVKWVHQHPVGRVRNPRPGRRWDSSRPHRQRTAEPRRARRCHGRAQALGSVHGNGGSAGDGHLALGSTSRPSGRPPPTTGRPGCLSCKHAGRSAAF